MNVASIIVLIIVLGLFFMAVKRVIKNKGCSDKCSNCANSTLCNNKNVKNNRTNIKIHNN